MAKSRVDRRINVYELGVSDYKAMPNDSVTYDEAVHMVKNWVAKWVDKCRGIQMLQGKAPVKVRDRSCSMGPRVIFLCAAGDYAAGELVKAWKPSRKAA